MLENDSSFFSAFPNEYSKFYARKKFPYGYAPSPEVHVNDDLLTFDDPFHDESMRIAKEQALQRIELRKKSQARILTYENGRVYNPFSYGLIANPNNGSNEPTDFRRSNDKAFDVPISDPEMVGGAINHNELFKYVQGRLKQRIQDLETQVPFSPAATSAPVTSEPKPVIGINERLELQASLQAIIDNLASGTNDRLDRFNMLDATKFVQLFIPFEIEAKPDDLQDLHAMIEEAVNRVDSLVALPIDDSPGSSGVTYSTHEIGLSLQSLLTRILAISRDFQTSEVQAMSQENKRKVMESLIKKLKLGRALKNSEVNLQNLSTADQIKLQQSQNVGLIKTPPLAGAPIPYDHRLWDVIRLATLKSLIIRFSGKIPREVNTLLAFLRVICGLTESEVKTIVAYLKDKSTDVPETTLAKLRSKKLKQPNEVTLPDPIPEVVEALDIPKKKEDIPRNADLLKELNQYLTLLGISTYKPRNGLYTATRSQIDTVWKHIQNSRP